MKKIKPDGSKTIYVGGIYGVDKTSGGAVTRTVTYYPAAGAMRINISGGSNSVYYILKDHLGSASVVTDSTGTIVGEQRYYPYGETRFTSGTVYTDKLFTSQREMTGLGIYHYGARFYSPKIGRFLSADTIVPGAANPQAWNRYSYVLGNPLKYVDPTGHIPCDADGYCNKKISTKTAIARLKVYIKFRYGIKMGDADGGKKWDLQNLSLMNTSLANIDAALDGNLKSLVGGSTFYMGEHHPDKDHPNSTYGGWTSGSNITFNTTGNQVIRQMNIYHEFGHLLNNMPGSDNVFSNAIPTDASFVTNNGTGILDTSALKSTLVDDLNYGQHVEAIQHECTCASEQWADIFANYVAGNIDLSKPTGPGRDMYNFVTGALEPYIRYYP